MTWVVPLPLPAGPALPVLGGFGAILGGVFDGVVGADGVDGEAKDGAKRLSPRAPERDPT